MDYTNIIIAACTIVTTTISICLILGRRFTKIENRLSKIEKRLTVIETIFMMMGYPVKGTGTDNDD